jgi:hypothetical protein
VTCLREEQIDGTVRSSLGRLTLLPEEKKYVAERIARLRSESARIEEETVRSLHLRTAQIKDRMSRLTDAYLDGVVDKETFEDKKSRMRTELKDVEEKLRGEISGKTLSDRAAEMVELATMAYFQYEQAFPEGKRDLLQILTSNRRADSKNVALTLYPPFQSIANRIQIANGAPQRDIGRTWDEILHSLVIIIRDTPLELFDRISGFLSTRRNEDPTPSSTRFHRASSNNENIPVG